MKMSTWGRQRASWLSVLSPRTPRKSAVVRAPDDPGQRGQAAEVHGLAAVDHVPRDVVERERAVGARHVPRGAAAVGVDRQHRRRRLHAVLGDEMRRVDALAL
jgi:hypothetical protein